MAISGQRGGVMASENKRKHGEGISASWRAAAASTSMKAKINSSNQSKRSAKIGMKE